MGARLLSGRSPVTLGFHRKLLGFLIQDIIDLLTQWLLVLGGMLDVRCITWAAHGLYNTGSVVAAVA